MWIDQPGRGLNKMDTRTLLIAGIPRSGTTWIARVLSSGKDTRLLMEPDNEKNSPIAWSLKRDVHRFPMIPPGEESSYYENLWRVIGHHRVRPAMTRLLYLGSFRHRQAALESYLQHKTGTMANGENSAGVYYSPQNHPFLDWMVGKMAIGRIFPPDRRKLIVKSVHGILVVDWISTVIPVEVLIVLRNPYSIFASQKRLRMPDISRNLPIQRPFRRWLQTLLGEDFQPPVGGVEGEIFQLLSMLKITSMQIQQNQDWHVVSHDRLCQHPGEIFRQLSTDLGLGWPPEMERTIAQLNRSGTGFESARIAKIQPNKWKSELSREEIQLIDKWSDIFGLSEFIDLYIS